MAINRAHVHQVSFAVQKEVGGYGVDPGAAAGGDMFRTLADAASIKRMIARLDRDQDARGNSYSVTTVVKGRESSEFSIPCDLIPANFALPANSPPDVDVLLEALFTSKHTATAHTTTRAGSVGTAIALAIGGGPASGLQAKDMIALDVSAAAGYEVRQVVSLGAAAQASADIGSGVDGTVTAEVDAPGSAGNSWTIEVVEGVGVGVAMSAGLVGTDITVTLGTDGAGALDPAKNTATLIAVAVSLLAGVTATASGAGTDSIGAAEGPTTFTGGLDVGDNIVVDRAFTTDPAAGRTVRVGTTYLLSATTAAITLTIKHWLAATLRQKKITGCIVNKGEISIDAGQDVPIGSIVFSGGGQAEETLADAEPTGVYAGSPLVPSKSKCWIGADAFVLAGGQSLSIDNGLVLCENEASSLEPTRPKRTGNNANYMIAQSLSMYATSGDQDTLAHFEAAQTLTAMDILVQLGIVPGSIVAWRTPAFKPEPALVALEGEVGITFGGGRCYAVNGDDEVTLAFL